MTERRKQSFFQTAIGSASGEDYTNAEEFFRRLLLSGLTVSDLGVINLTAVPGFPLNADNLLSGTVPLARLVGIANAQISASAAIAQSKLSLSITNAEVATLAAIAYSKLNLSGSIVNGDVSVSAAIAYAKLNLALSIVNGDISAGAAIAQSKLSLSITNAEVNAAAAIALSKLAGWPANAAGALVNNGSGTLSWALLAGRICEGRLTGTSGTSVTSADVTGVTSIYFTPHIGNRLALYDGSTTWNIREFSEITISLSGLTASKPYDIFAYDNAGTVTIETLIWTNTTTRATALVRQDGVLVKTGATTRRYLGTVFINSTGGQTDDSATKRFIYNHYNQKTRALRKIDTSVGSYNSNTIRQLDADTANKVEVMIGWDDAAVYLEATVTVTGDTNNAALKIGIGEDSTTTYSSSQIGGSWFTGVGIATTGSYFPVLARLSILPSVGYHFYSFNQSVSVGTANYLGSGDGTVTGLTGSTQG